MKKIFYIFYSLIFLFLSTNCYTALQSDGSDDDINFGTSTFWDFLDYNKPFTIQCWINPRSIITQRPVFSKQDTLSGAGHYYKGIVLSHDANGKLWLQIGADNQTGDSEIVWTTSFDSLTLNKWQNIAVTYNGNGRASGVKYYLNGSISSTTVYAYDKQLTASFVNTNVATLWKNDTGATTYGYSLLSDFRIYSRTLSMAEIKSNVKRFAGWDKNLMCWWKLDEMVGIYVKDSSGNNITGTFVSVPVWVIYYSPIITNPLDIKEGKIIINPLEYWLVKLINSICNTDIRI